jgi:hypothetical protein
MFNISTTVSTGSAVVLQISALGSQTSYAISASNGIIAGTIFTATNISASNISASGQIIATGFTGSLLGTSSWSNNSINTLSSSITSINDNSTYYVTFVDGTTGTRTLKTDTDILSYIPSTNTLKVGNTSGSLLISNDSGTNPNYISLVSDPNSNSGATVQVGNPALNANCFIYCWKSKC